MYCEAWARTGVQLGRRMAHCIAVGLGVSLLTLVNDKPALAHEVHVFVGAGDIAGDNMRAERTAKLLDKVVAKHPGAVVFTTGDNAYPEGTAEEFTNFYEPTWGRHKARTRPTVGNHEYRTPGAKGYFDYFGEAAGEPGKGYYSYRLGAWLVLALNSEIDASPGSAQERWLHDELAADPSDCILAYMHRPLFSGGRYAEDAQMEWLWKTLYEAGADVVLAGHQHAYERFAPQDPQGRADLVQGIRQIVVGTGGISLYDFESEAPNTEVRDNTSYGVLKLTLRPLGYDWEFIPASGHSFTDAGSADCSTTVPAIRSLRVGTRIAHSADDAEEVRQTGAVLLDSSDIDLVDDRWDGVEEEIPQLAGLRFSGLEIPKGVRIVDAHLQFRARHDASDPTSVVIRGEAADDSARFTTQRRDISTRPQTRAAVSWEPEAWTSGAVGIAQRTPSLAPIIQEIVDRQGWEPSNALTLIIDGHGHRSAQSHDYRPEEAPLLVVEYMVDRE
jgi:acid phosphatase type 7